MKEKSLMGAKAVVLRLFPYKESSIPSKTITRGVGWSSRLSNSRTKN